MGFEIILGDTNEDLCRAWAARIDHKSVSVHHGDFFDISADAYVSPANSHGIMDGGFDLLLRQRFPGIEVSVQREVDGCGGLLPVGTAIVVETGDFDVPYVVFAPTMLAPANVAGTNNAYEAMFAILKAVQEFNDLHDDAIEALAIPGLGTGVGGMAPFAAATQMAKALEEFLAD